MVDEDPGQLENEERHVTLRSLGPEFDEAQHGVYLRHLEEAVLEKKTRNIALTGRYGAGKSSVLDAFEKKHPKSTVRISINTLGPDEDDEDLTNRIQKELVKQLVYRLEPGKIRRSRFARPKPLTKTRAFVQALGASAVGLGILWLLGVRPMADWPGAGADATARVGLAALFFGLVLLAAWAVRWIIGDRIVSEVTTAGTKIALGEGPTTYFDSFLDEIVAFFDAVEPAFVIFEDLDRFDDPQIFDSLRELNTLVNASVGWRDKTQPLRFIYAIKDSLFEQLGADPEPDAAGATPRLDVAAAAVQRANRTKFFEMVIPIVPFISHRNARDHLAGALVSLGFEDGLVSRPLLDLIARHTTDMRLMINICNEFAVFAEHLLWAENPAPGMTPDHLFALVAYKNFHLADFEAISQRTSTLDEFERLHRDEVRALISGLQDQRRERQRTEEQRERRERTAPELGRRLRDVKDMFPPANGWPYVSVTVDGQSFAFDAVDTVEFWELVAKEKSFAITQRHNSSPLVLDQERLGRVFPEITNAAEWLPPDPAELARLTRQYDSDISTLRGADFDGLARYERVPKGRIRFDERIDEVLESELARDLVRRGFITRNYAEYSAIFYGSFVGVDVAFFYNHAVQPNEMYLDYEFTSENAMSNLLEQVPADFTSSVSALNIRVASYLLDERPDEAEKLVAYMVTHDDANVRTFIDAFLNAPDAPREALVRQLARHPWRETFEYLASHPGISDHATRIRLFDTALLSARHVDSYEIGEAARPLIGSSYPLLTAVREDHDPERTVRVFEFLEAVGLVVEELSTLNALLRDRVVGARMYAVNVKNLRVALGIETEPTLDAVRTNGSVWEFCRTRISDYVSTMDAALPDQPIVLTEGALIGILNEQHDVWTEETIREVLDRSADTSAIENVGDVPRSTWPAVVDACLMVPTVANIFAYVEAHGIDEGLSGLLAGDGGDPLELQEVDMTEEADRNALAVRLLNASAHLKPDARVRLVEQLRLDSEIEVTDVTPSSDGLLAWALEAKLLPDTAETFSHFVAGGWKSVAEAFAVSARISEFMAPALVTGFVGEFLESRRTPVALRRRVLEHLDEYVPGDDRRALRAAGRFALDNQIWLPFDVVRRIARVTRDPEVVLRQLTHAKDIPAGDLSDVLASLGQPYDKLAAGPEVEFDLPAGSSNETLFKRLESAGRITIVRKVVGRGRRIRTLV
ncbi:hypothetical protein HUN08_12835 [Gordonia sp. X0973]|uniref:YobI family P-loop NTPase n=1 Tax=Gordonia sp. X0973 TaxID=2742602 RepID=UPI000F51DEE6|nr:hypothetical protein [Gordonia sp. X0973]QKT07970.1 hypothetical protein HUN08_12835 [Gordonia sp. X0973]